MIPKTVQRAALTLWVSISIGCAPTSVRPVPTSSDATPLPRPDRVLVHDFAVSLADVKLNSGPGARLLRRLSSTPPSDEQARLGRQVAAAFAEELVKEIREMGLAAERAPRGPGLPDRMLAVDGQFLTIDEGNRAR